MKGYVIWGISRFFSYPRLTGFGGFVFGSIFMAISLSVLVFQYKNARSIETLYRYNRIKKNLKTWYLTILGAQEEEQDWGKQVAKNSRETILQWNCVDGGSFYLPTRLGPHFLPEAIRRGTGGAWKVTKAADHDPSALQFCEYLIATRTNEIITCGLDAFNKTGTSGLFERTHWCGDLWKEYITDQSK